LVSARARHADPTNTPITQAPQGLLPPTPPHLRQESLNPSEKSSTLVTDDDCDKQTGANSVAWMGDHDAEFAVHYHMWVPFESTGLQNVSSDNCGDATGVWRDSIRNCPRWIQGFVALVTDK